MLASILEHTDKLGRISNKMHFNIFCLLRESDTKNILENRCKDANLYYG